MKVIKIYSENNPMCDLSKDRVILDLSYNEFEKIRSFTDFARWDMYEYKEHQNKIRKKAKSLWATLVNAEQQCSIWTTKPKRIKFLRWEDDK